jgi:DNA-binding MurR/RpiR family transcriptional regulator
MPTASELKKVERVIKRCEREGRDYSTNYLAKQTGLSTNTVYRCQEKLGF